VLEDDGRVVCGRLCVAPTVESLSAVAQAALGGRRGGTKVRSGVRAELGRAWIADRGVLRPRRAGCLPGCVLGRKLAELAPVPAAARQGPGWDRRGRTLAVGRR